MEEHERLRDLIVRLADDPEWLTRLATTMSAAVYAADPDAHGDDELAAGALAAAKGVLRQIVYMIRNVVPPDQATLPPLAAEQMRRFVRRGTSLDTLLRAYQVGHAIFFREWAAVAHRILHDPQRASDAIELGARWTFEYVAALSARTVEEYREESERWVNSAAAGRLEAVEALLSERAADVDGLERRLGYDLRRRHLGFVVWTDPDEPAADAPALVRRGAAADRLAAALGLGRPLLVPLDGSLTAGWVGVPDGKVSPPARLEDDGAAGAKIALGTAAASVDGFRLSHRQAMQARRVAELTGAGAGSVTSYPDIALVALASHDQPQARAFVAAELGLLAAADKQTAKLASTLLVYLQEGMSPRRVARRLRIHENTVANRVRAAEQLLGHPIGERTAELEVALRMARFE